MKPFVTFLLILISVAYSYGCDKIEEIIQPGGTFSFESPGYPAEYTGGSNCEYSFTSTTNLTLYCSSFDIKKIAKRCRKNRFIISETNDILCNLDSNTLTKTVMGGTLTMKMRRPKRVTSETYGSYTCTVTAADADADADADPPITNTACTCHSTASRIVGGTETVEREFPHQVALFVGGFFCGANIVNNQTIMTAAHCAYANQGNPGVFVPRVGGHSSNSSDGTEVDVERVIVHPNYNPNNIADGNDVALLILTNPLDFSDPSIAPVCLPTGIDPDTEFTSLTSITIVGWGKTNGANAFEIGNLMKSDVLYYTRPDCQDRIGPIIGFLQPSIICITSAASDSGTCQGDSGGPALFQMGNTNYLMGVTSFGIGNGADSCLTSYPSSFANVHYLLPWIEDNVMGGLCSPAP